MERDLHDELIDLGAASVETEGPIQKSIEFGVVGSLPGISDDE